MVIALQHGGAARNDHLRLGGLRRHGQRFGFRGRRRVVGQAAHDEADVHIARQGQLAHLAAHHARTLAVPAHHNLQRLGHAPAQAVHRLHIALAHKGQQLAQHGLRGRQGNVDLRAVHQIRIAAAVDERQHPAGAHALGQQARHDVVLVVLGQRQEQVHLFHALVIEQVFVGGLALQHQHRRRQRRGQLHTALWV